jgi:DNA repair photolyase
MPAPAPDTRTKGDEALPDLPRKGRGSVSNRPSHRFGVADRYEIDDGWSDHEREDWAKVRRKTILSVDTVRHIITRNTSPDIHFDRSINPYKGCEHGCIYCFARPTHAYLDLSPGKDFETRIFRKPDAADALRRELSARSYTPAPIALGINTDAYQPTERSEKLTRAILQVLYEFRHPVHIVTKSALIQRDLDILAPMAELRLFKATLSVTTLDRDLARIMEPRAATPMKRLETVRILSAAGIPTNVLVAPVIPGLTDHEIEAILEAAAAHGAVRAGGALIRLPHEIKTLFEEWLRTHFPDRADKVLNHIRKCRDGKLYNAEFGSRMRGTGPYAELIQKRLSLGIKRYGLDKPSSSFDLSIFRGGDPQMSLF